MQPSVYRATTLLTINQQLPGQDAYSSLLASDQLVVTYEALISQPVVLTRAAHEVGGSLAAQLAQRVTVQDQPGTQIIQLSVDDTSPHRAAALANAVAAAFIAIHQESADAKLSSAEQQLEQQLKQIASQITSLPLALTRSARRIQIVRSLRRYNSSYRQRPHAVTIYRPSIASSSLRTLPRATLSSCFSPPFPHFGRTTPTRS